MAESWPGPLLHRVNPLSSPWWDFSPEEQKNGRSTSSPPRPIPPNLCWMLPARRQVRRGAASLPTRLSERRIQASQVSFLPGIGRQAFCVKSQHINLSTILRANWIPSHGLKCCLLARFNERLWPALLPTPPTRHPALSEPPLASPGESIPGAQPGASQGLLHTPALPLPAQPPGFLPAAAAFSPCSHSLSPNAACPPSSLPLRLSLLLSVLWQLLPMQRDAPIHSASQTL